MSKTIFEVMALAIRDCGVGWPRRAILLDQARAFYGPDAPAPDGFYDRMVMAIRDFYECGWMDWPTI